MKKTILIVGLVVLALGVFGVGAALAQDVQPPVGRGAMTLALGASAGVGGGYGPMHDYVEEALADKLGITEKNVEDALASGKTMYQIALDNGVKEADVAALLTEVHTTAFDKAVADGIMATARCRMGKADSMVGVMAMVMAA
jgi:F420-0:gamma-glutamyl ligase